MVPAILPQMMNFVFSGLLVSSKNTAARITETKDPPTITSAVYFKISFKKSPFSSYQTDITRASSQKIH